MIGTGIPSLVRDTLLGACLGVVPLAFLMCIHHILAWRKGDRDAPIYLLVRAGTMFLVLPIIFLVWPLDEINPDWTTYMFLTGCLMVGTGYFIFARRWGREVVRQFRHREKGERHDQ